LLDAVIIILTSCSILIFVFTIGAKFLGRDTFDKLPDFIKDSYSALWSAGAVAGGALAGSVVDALSRRESTKSNFVVYILVTTLLIMALIVGTIELSRSIEGPQFAVPTGATPIRVSKSTQQPVDFYLQNKLSGNPVRVRGSFEIKNGRLTGQVTESELDPMQGPGAPNVRLTTISIHVCFLAVRNGFPILTQLPEFPTEANREKISAMANLQTPYEIPEFKFSIPIEHIDNIAPPYLCAFIDGEQNAQLILF